MPNCSAISVKLSPAQAKLDSGTSEAKSAKPSPWPPWPPCTFKDHMRTLIWQPYNQFYVNSSYPISIVLHPFDRCWRVSVPLLPVRPRLRPSLRRAWPARRYRPWLGRSLPGQFVIVVRAVQPASEADIRKIYLPREFFPFVRLLIQYRLVGMATTFGRL